MLLSGLSPNSFTIKGEEPEGKTGSFQVSRRRVVRLVVCRTPFRRVETSLSAAPVRTWPDRASSSRFPFLSARQEKKRGAPEGRETGAGGAKAAGSAHARRSGEYTLNVCGRCGRRVSAAAGGGALRLVVRVGRGRAGTAAEARTGD